MCHIGLKSQRAGPIDPLQKVEHLFPAMHPAPTNLPFSSQPLTKILSHVTSFAECLRDACPALFRVRCPIAHPTRRVDPNNTIRTHTQLTQPLGNTTTFA